MLLLLLKVVLHALTDYAVASPKFFEVHVFLTCVCNELPFFAGSSATYFFPAVLFFSFLVYFELHPKVPYSHFLLASQRKRNHVWLHWILKNQEGGLIYSSSKKSKSEICGPWFVHHLWLPTYLPGLVDISRSNICSIYVASRFVYNRVDFLLLFLVSFFWSCRNFCYC